MKRSRSIAQVMSSSAVGLTLAGTAVILACGTTEEPPPPPSCVSADCGTGLRCEQQSAAKRTCGDASAGSSNDQPTCEVPRALSQLELVSGFGVAEFDLAVETPDGSSQIVMTWFAPERSRTVACALFRCRPEVFGVSPSSPDSGWHGPFQTFPRCVLAIGFFDARRGNGAVSDLQPPEGTANVADAGALQELMVGCWAYDDVKIVGATRLKQVPPDRTFAAPGFAAECDGNDEKACIVADGIPLGVCRSGVCRVRCRTDDDCAGAPPEPQPEVAESSEPDDVSTDAGGEDARPDGEPTDAGAFDGEVEEVESGAPDASTELCRHYCERDEASSFGVCRERL